MKKTTKKLALNKETLRSLAMGQVRDVEGGAPPQTQRRDCYSKQYSFCDTCGIACTVECNF